MQTKHEPSMWYQMQGTSSHGKIQTRDHEREQVGDLVIMNEENSLMLNPEDDNDNDQSGKTN